MARGEGRAQRYLGNWVTSQPRLGDVPNSFPSSIALSADSRDVLAYVDQPLTARKPVGYQVDFLAAYQPNVTTYLSASLRRQLEGTPYSWLNIQALIEHGQSAQGKVAMETQMILNHKTAIELLVGKVGRAAFGHDTLMNLHAAFDMFMWAYERSTQEHLTIKQDLAEPDPTRLA